ncbi:ATP-dependent Clp protease ATP-binding subunit, partial [Candidatus Dojkabacteria bacterium]
YKEIITESLKEKLSPELINRIGLILIFNKINYESARTIVLKQIDKLSEDLIKRGLMLKVGSNVIDHILKKGYSEEYGVRNLQRVLDKEIKSKIADYLIKNQISLSPTKPMLVSVDMKEGEGDSYEVVIDIV